MELAFKNVIKLERSVFAEEAIWGTLFVLTAPAFEVLANRVACCEINYLIRFWMENLQIHSKTPSIYLGNCCSQRRSIA